MTTTPAIVPANLAAFLSDVQEAKRLLDDLVALRGFGDQTATFAAVKERRTALQAKVAALAAAYAAYAVAAAQDHREEMGELRHRVCRPEYAQARMRKETHDEGWDYREGTDPDEERACAGITAARAAALEAAFGRPVSWEEAPALTRAAHNAAYGIVQEVSDFLTVQLTLEDIQSGHHRLMLTHSWVSKYVRDEAPPSLGLLPRAGMVRMLTGGDWSEAVKWVRIAAASWDARGKFIAEEAEERRRLGKPWHWRRQQPFVGALEGATTTRYHTEMEEDASRISVWPTGKLLVSVP